MAIRLPLLLAALPFLVNAQNAIYTQCGGNNWTGGTTCVAGTTCNKFNDWYSQCLPSAIASPASSKPATTAAATTKASTSSSAPASSAAAPSASSGASGFHTAAKAAGLTYFGSATDNGELTDATYKAFLSDSSVFGQITPGNSMKWDSTEPTQGQFTFTKGDVIADLAAANGQLLRGHTTVWHSQLPNWVTSGNFDNATLTGIMTNHVSKVIGHYAGEVYAWDVVNEVLNDDGTLRESVFFNTIGESYIATAFKTARAADPNAKLYINDFSIEGTGAKSTAMINLVSSLLDQGVPVDGIGIQAHLIVGSVPTTLQENWQAMADLGVEIAITELDIRMTLPATDALLKQQATDYQTVVNACLAVKGCVGITIWDWTDKFSWVPSTFSGQGAALPYDEKFAAKPAVDAILSSLGA
ncbi:glycoside hydrolase family 10 protein [Cylindrobasidium torrendii FP15055 ss-10]|uniref:Beta-xylanase n=1 Tax=Cylindrobasidium torrendii FP15055 ss-10 TaxID=1314674 RepID=A0A0D7B487_9AGAR|nr:glycoside hydrolase family 10 protein [Cylindrobasidium torrendii FP15055 ss-10]